MKSRHSGCLVAVSFPWRCHYRSGVGVQLLWGLDAGRPGPQVEKALAFLSRYAPVGSSDDSTPKEYVLCHETLL